MAKPTKVKYDVSDDDECESDACRNDDNDDEEEEEEYTKEELMDMCEQLHTCFEIKRKECKELSKKVKFLEQSLDELNATYERLMEAHEKWKDQDAQEGGWIGLILNFLSIIKSYG